MLFVLYRFFPWISFSSIFYLCNKTKRGRRKKRRKRYLSPLNKKRTIMKAIPFLFTLTACGLCACTPFAPKNTIEGQIDGLKTGDRIVLTTGTLTQTPIPTDSVTIPQDGYFSLATPATDTYANLLLVKEGETLDVNSNPSAGLFLEGCTTITKR